MNALKGRRAAVIGAGIGGLAAALALARRGADVTVHEQAPALTEVGAGIQISPNGGRVLAALGLADALDAASLRSEAVELADALTGRRVLRMDLSGQTPPFRLFHRAELLGLLARACTSEGVQITLGARVAGFTPDGQVTTGAGQDSFDLVISADGVRSAGRALLNGAASPRFTGQVAWRALVAGRGGPAQATVYMAPGGHLVTYPLAGHGMNLVAVRERAAWAEEGWHHEDDPENLRRAFAGACEAVQGLLAEVKSTQLWGLFLHPVAARWHAGRAALLGDAAHPTLPFLAQGANLALEDAWVLADCLDRMPAEAALAAYQARRRPRVARAIAAASANARNYHLRNPLLRRGAHAALRLGSALLPGAPLRRFAWLHDHDVTRP